MSYDIIIKNGLYFDGGGADGVPRHIGVRDGRVAAVSAEPLDESGCERVIEARGCWVAPGFIEPHSHYDVEVIAAPALKESVRHGITTVTVGSCSISMLIGEAEDCSDLFTRVEAVPREGVLPLLREKKSWKTPAQYRAFFDQHPLGPNVCSFIGHSEMRVAAMGLERATSKLRPTEAELAQMEETLEQALDAGMLGLSLMTTRLDKMDGDRAWSRPLPSTYARWREFGRLFGVLRRRGAVMQGAPDAVGKINLFAFLFHAVSRFGRKLKMSMLTAMDLKSQPYLHVLTRLSSWLTNVVLRGDYRWQLLPHPFQVYPRGLQFNSFEEFTSGEEILDLKDNEDRYEKIRDPAFRAKMKKQLGAILSRGVWHRDFSDAFVVDCPDKSLIGKNYGQIGAEQGKDPVDAFFDLCLEYGEGLHWSTVMANHRPAVLKKLLAFPYTQIGFADSGAHIIQMANYNFPLRMLKLVHDSEKAGNPFISTGRAIHRLTGELADWFGMQAGHIREGDRADIVVINPAGLTYEVGQVHPDRIENLGLERLVNRNEAAVEATVINGRVAYTRAQGFAAGLGTDRVFGRFLPSTLVRPRPQAAPAGANPAAA